MLFNCGIASSQSLKRVHIRGFLKKIRVRCYNIYQQGISGTCELTNRRPLDFEALSMPSFQRMEFFSVELGGSSDFPKINSSSCITALQPCLKGLKPQLRLVQLITKLAL